MAINIKELLCDTLISLNQTKKLTQITIKDILLKSGVSRQTFYNHFIDKDDLIHYIYDHRIVGEFDGNFDHFDFCTSLKLSMNKMKEHKKFLKEACMIEGQNCLKDHISTHCVEFDLKWHQYLYGEKQMPEALRFATIYHANASSSMTLSWILSDMTSSIDEMVDMITTMRGIGMDELFKGGKSSNPYHVDK